MKLPAVKEAFYLVFHELGFLIAEAVGLIGAAGIIKALFWILEWIHGEEFPALVHRIPYYIEILEFFVFTLFCGGLHLTRMGKHLKELFSKENTEQQREEQAKQEVLLSRPPDSIPMTLDTIEERENQ